MSTGTDERTCAYGLSIDHGWSDSDDAPLSGLRSLLFLAAGGVYFGSIWLLSGLAPLPILLSRMRGNRAENSYLPVDALPPSDANWRKPLA
jgi:hypothetical protein